MLYNTFSCVILDTSPNALLTFDSEGLKFLTHNDSSSVLCDLDVFEPYDELIYLPPLKRLIFIKFGDEIHFTFVFPNMETKLLELDGLAYIDNSHGVTELTVHGDQLVGFSESTTSTVVSFRFSKNSKNWIVQANTRPQTRVPGTLVAILDNAIITHQSNIPFEPIITVFNSCGTILFQSASPTYIIFDQQLITASKMQDPPTIQRWSIHKDATKHKTPGHIISFCDYDNCIFATIVEEGTEIVYRMTEEDSKSISFHPIWRGSGKKVVSKTSQSMVGLSRDTINGVTFHVFNQLGERKSQTLMPWTKPQGIKVQYFSSTQGAHAIVFSPATRPRSQVLHFHGGPDAYEVEELRFFGAFHTLLRSGVEIVVLNYRGSTGMGSAAHVSAWKQWQKVFLEDLEWLNHKKILSSELSLITAGWSFGGALAFLASQHFTQARGTILGGALTDLQKHITRAVQEDQKYQKWFDDRFGPHEKKNEECVSFFSLHKSLKHPIPVLSFHGIHDEHCSYTDLDFLRKEAISAGFDWHHYDLPGGEHYAACIEDASMIYSKTIEFISDII